MGQHLVPTKWIFSIKTDGTYKPRCIGRGDLMIAWVDFNPKEIMDTIDIDTDHKMYFAKGSAIEKCSQ